MSTRIQTSTYQEVWTALRARIARKLKWDKDRIWLIGERQEPDKLPTGPLLTVKFLKEVPSPGGRIPVGPGRWGRKVAGSFLVTAWNRDARPQAGRQEHLLVSSDGILVIAEMVTDALDQKNLYLGDAAPADGGRQLLTELMHWSEDGDETERRLDRSHGGIPLQFDYERCRDLDTDINPYS